MCRKLAPAQRSCNADDGTSAFWPGQKNQGDELFAGSN